MLNTLFDLPGDAYAKTSDDIYTPKWIFDAMGLEFDLDPASPFEGPWHVPAEEFYTPADDGLFLPWFGLVFCNPPWSEFTYWAERYRRHPTAVIMGLCLSETLWFPRVLEASDAVSFISVEFHRAVPGPRNNGGRVRFRQHCFVAFRGVGTEPAERLSAADPYGATLYGPAGRV